MTLSSLISTIHTKCVFGRRVQILAHCINAMLLEDVHTIIDVGCGDGSVSHLIARRRKEVTITGLDVIRRKHCFIDYTVYDGRTMPLADNTCDAAFLIDVLHHTKDIDAVFNETARVSKKYVIVKDHIYQNPLDYVLLQIMDWVGNAHFGVNLPYNYKKKEYWKTLFQKNGRRIEAWSEDVPLYPFPMNLLCGRHLHFIARIAV